MQRLPGKPEGYALDLDSTRLLHEDGVEVGYTRVGTKPCLHPLLAIFSEVRLVAAFWLRPGNCSCANNVAGFFLDLWDTCRRTCGCAWCAPTPASTWPSYCGCGNSCG